MTVPVSGPSYFEYLADGGATERSIGFPVRRVSDLVVAANGVPQVLGTHYTVVGTAPNQKIKPLAPFWPADTAIAYWRSTARAQEYKIVAGVDLNNESLEDELDRQALINQEQDREFGRALSVPRGQVAPVLDTTAFAEGDLLEYRGGKIQRFDAAQFKGKLYGGSAVTGLPIPVAGGGADPTLRDDLAEVGDALVSVLPEGAGGIPRQLREKLREMQRSVMDYGAIGDGTLHTVAEWIVPGALARYASLAELQDHYPHVTSTTDSIDWAAWQRGVNFLQDGDGGTLTYPPRTFVFNTKGLIIGDASEASPFNSKAPVALRSTAPVSGVGFLSPSNCTIIKSSVPGYAIEFRANLGWGLQGIAFTFDTVSPAAGAFALFNAKSGDLEDVTILNCPGMVHTLLYSWGGTNGNVEFNKLKNVFVFMGADSPAGAIAMKLDAKSDGFADPAHNTIENMTVQPDKASHIGWYFGHADTNFMLNCRFKPLVGFLPAIAAVFDYTAHAGGYFPNNNQFIGGSNYTSTIQSIGTPTHPGQVSNRWNGVDLGNNSPVPTAAGFAFERLVLSRDTTFFVNQSASGVGLFGPGDPSSFGIYQGRPCKTVQQAYDQLVRFFDLNGFTVTIDIADGTYTAGCDASRPITGGGKVIFKGQGGGTVFSGAGTPFISRAGTAFEVRSMNIAPSTGYGVLATGGLLLVGTGVIFGGVTASHICADNDGNAVRAGNYFVNGNAAAHLEARHGSLISGTGSMTLLANVNITNFAVADEASNIRADSMTHVLNGFTSTGNRYAARFNAVIDTGGGGASFFPGSTAGSETDGGKYK